MSSIIAPSILAADFACLGEEVKSITDAGADWIHCDVMDGHFVNNISFGSAFVEAASRHTHLPLDTHLMISRPDLYLDRYLPISSSINIHLEAESNVAETLRTIRSFNKKAGLAINPDTPISAIAPHLGEFDILLVMTVHPGFGGQPFMESMLPKIQAASDLRSGSGCPFLITVDGGINPTTGALCRDAGADILVAGTSVFRAHDRRVEINALR